MPESVPSGLRIHIEIPLFFLFFAFTICDAVNSNLIIFRTCYVTLGYSKKECALLGSQNPDNQTMNLERIAEPYAAIVNMMRSLLEGLSSGLACFFVGPWSDRFGRKPVLIISVTGYFLFYVLSSVFAALENISPWYSLICLLPVCLSGGTPSYLTAVLCHITDSTNDDNRGMKMGIFEATLYSGVFLGTLLSSYVFTVTNYTIVYLIAAMCCLWNLLLTVFFVPESLTNRESEDPFKKLFQLTSVTEMVQVTFKKRQNYARYTVLCCILLMIFAIVIINGNGAVTFLFLRDKFQWSLQKYTLFAASSSVIYVFGAVGGVYILHKLLKIPETIMILVSLLSALNGVLLMGLAKSSWVIYIVPLAKLLDSVFGPMTRSLVSKAVAKEEVGKIFALTTTSQFLFGIIGSPIYTFIYNYTIAINPALFNFISAGIYILCICITISLITVRSVKNSINASMHGENGDSSSVASNQVII